MTSSTWLLWASQVLFYSGIHLGRGDYWNSSWGQWDGPCPIHAHILVGIEHPPHSNESSWFGNMFWLMNLPFMSNIFVLRDTAKPSSPRTILQHAAVSRPRLTICIASICSVRSKLSRSIDSVFFLSFCEYHELRNTRPLESCLVRRNGKFVCLGIREACWMCLLLYGSQVWFDYGLLPKSYLQNSCQVIIIFFIGHTSCSACLSSSMRPIFFWALLCSGFFSPQLIMLKIIPHTTNWVSLHHAHVSHRLSASLYETLHTPR